KIDNSEPKNATPGLDRRRPATNGSALSGSPENRYHSLEVQGSSSESRLIWAESKWHGRLSKCSGFPEIFLPAKGGGTTILLCVPLNQRMERPGLKLLTQSFPRIASNRFWRYRPNQPKSFFLKRRAKVGKSFKHRAAGWYEHSRARHALAHAS